MRVLAAALVASLAVVGIELRSADACSLFAWDEHRLDAAYADDATPPSPIAGVTVDVYRGEGGCEGQGIVTISFTASDDRAPSDRIGYDVENVTGFDDTFRFFDGAGLFPLVPGDYLSYFTDHGQDIDGELDMVAVDLNGNRSAPVRVHVADEVPASAGGCAVGERGALHGSAILVVLAALLARRRLRARGHELGRSRPWRG